MGIDKQHKYYTRGDYNLFSGVRAITTSSKKLGGATLQQQAIEVGRRLEKLMTTFNMKTRKKIARKGAAPVRKAMRALVKDAPALQIPSAEGAATVRYHPNSGKRASPDEGRVAAYIFPGSLRRSVRTMTFRKSPYAYVGPLYAGRKGRVGLSVPTADGYYAHMAYGGAEGWIKTIKNKAMAISAHESFARQRAAINAELQVFKAKTGL